jgi:flavodoxin
MNSNESNKNFQQKILIAYYSFSGHTENVANQIKELVGGDFFKIELVNKYPASYREVLKISKQEIDNNQKPSIKELVKNMEQYDIVFVGTPNWYSTMAPPVATFLSKHNLSEKKIIPFVTHGGGGEARCIVDIKKMCSQATVLEGIAISGSKAETASKEIKVWLKELQIFGN